MQGGRGRPCSAAAHPWLAAAWVARSLPATLSTLVYRSAAGRWWGERERGRQVWRMQLRACALASRAASKNLTVIPAPRHAAAAARVPRAADPRLQQDHVFPARRCQAISGAQARQAAPNDRHVAGLDRPVQRGKPLAQPLGLLPAVAARAQHVGSVVRALRGARRRSSCGGRHDCARRLDAEQGVGRGAVDGACLTAHMEWKCTLARDSWRDQSRAQVPTTRAALSVPHLAGFDYGASTTASHGGQQTAFIGLSGGRARQKASQSATLPSRAPSACCHVASA